MLATDFQILFGQYIRSLRYIPKNIFFFFFLVPVVRARHLIVVFQGKTDPVENIMEGDSQGETMQDNRVEDLPKVQEVQQFRSANSVYLLEIQRTSLGIRVKDVFRNLRVLRTSQPSVFFKIVFCFVFFVVVFLFFFVFFNV
jgi:hypothetical protein